MALSDVSNEDLIGELTRRGASALSGGRGTPPVQMPAGGGTPPVQMPIYVTTGDVERGGKPTRVPVNGYAPFPEPSGNGTVPAPASSGSSPARDELQRRIEVESLVRAKLSGRPERWAVSSGGYVPHDYEEDRIRQETYSQFGLDPNGRAVGVPSSRSSSGMNSDYSGGSLGNPSTPRLDALKAANPGMQTGVTPNPYPGPTGSSVDTSAQANRNSNEQAMRDLYAVGYANQMRNPDGSVKQGASIGFDYNTGNIVTKNADGSIEQWSQGAMDWARDKVKEQRSPLNPNTAAGQAYLGKLDAIRQGLTDPQARLFPGAVEKGTPGTVNWTTNDKTGVSIPTSYTQGTPDKAKPLQEGETRTARIIGEDGKDHGSISISKPKPADVVYPRVKDETTGGDWVPDNAKAAEQRRPWIEQELRKGNIADALSAMTKQERAAYNTGMANISEDKSNGAPTAGLTPESQAGMVKGQLAQSLNTVKSGWTEAADAAFAKQVNAYNAQQDKAGQANFEQFKKDNPQTYRAFMVDWLKENQDHPEAKDVQSRIDAIKQNKGAFDAEQKRQMQEVKSRVAKSTRAATPQDVQNEIADEELVKKTNAYFNR